MSGPPPPPPLGALPPPPMPASFPKGSGSDDRSALLKSIQRGAKLKKTVTNDKSALLIRGKVGNNNSNGGPSPVRPSTASPAPAANGLTLGGLFAGGMPKLRPTGKINSVPSNNNNNEVPNRRPEAPAQPIRNMSSLQNELKKQMANDNRNRGPPPPAPIRTTPEENGPRPQLQNGYTQNPSHLHSNPPSQNSTLHRSIKSNPNINSLDSTDFINGTKPVISHGKPNLAPKPPAFNSRPAPPKKLITNGKIVSRAQSMRTPRSPTPPSPDYNQGAKFGTVRNLSSVIGQSLANSTGNLSPRPRPMLNGRPAGPPPSIPTAPMTPPHGALPPPPSKTAFVKPPNHAPPPPPQFLPQPPSHTPPPPPHRTQPMRAPPAVPAACNQIAPPPPPRHSSMTSVRRAATDFEDRFKDTFRPPSTFPKPPPYRNVHKFYGNKHSTA